MFDGKLRRYSCKTQDKDVAEEVASAIHADSIRSRFNIPSKNKADRIFGEVWTEYVKLQSKPDNRKRTASNHFLSIFGNEELNNIATPDIKNYKIQRKFEIIAVPKNEGKRESEINFRSINYEIAILRNFFNHCIEKGYLDKNPATGIKKLNELSRLKTYPIPIFKN
jgi:hypothetical protein